MIPGIQPPGIQGWGHPNWEGVDESVAPLIEALKENFELKRFILAEAQPYDPVDTTTVDFHYSDSVVLLTTKYPKRLTSTVKYTSRVDISNISRPGAAVSFGSVRFSIMPDDTEANDQLGQYWRYRWGGRDLNLYLGGEGFTRADYELIQSGKIREALWGEAPDGDFLELTFKDATEPLRTTPLSQEKFAGTGGVEGDEGLTGTRWPMAFGPAKNITPALIDAVNLVYAWHPPTRATQALDAVYDSAFELSPGAEVGDVWAHSFVDPAQMFVYELDRNVVRLQYQPAGLVTLDVQGDAEGGYVSTAADIARRMAEIAGISPSKIEGDGNVNRATSAEVSYYVPTGSQVATYEAMTVVMSAVWGFVTSNRRGNIRLGRVSLTGGTPDRVIPEGKVLSMVSRTAPTPTKELSFGYAPAWTVQDESTQASNADTAHKEFVSKQFRRPTPSTDPGATDELLNAEDFDFDTVLAYLADAAMEQARVFETLGQRLVVYSAVVQHQLHFLDAGSLVWLTYPKFGLDNGHTFLVLEVVDDTRSGKTGLVLLGEEVL
jgi:hypothetical protein